MARRSPSPRQRLWFLDQLEPGSAMYNMPVALRLTGALDRGGARRGPGRDRAPSRGAAHHLPERSGRAGGRWSRRPPGSPCRLVDLAALPAVARRQEAERLSGVEARRPFDLARDPLLRARRCWRLAAEEHVAATDAAPHRRATAGRSGCLTRELAALYAAFREGSPQPLPELPVQYADFAALAAPAGCGRACWRRSWPTGAGSSRGCRRRSSCRRTVRARPFASCGGSGHRLRDRRGGSRRARWLLPGGTGRRCS